MALRCINVFPGNSCSVSFILDLLSTHASTSSYSVNKFLCCRKSAMIRWWNCPNQGAPCSVLYKKIWSTYSLITLAILRSRGVSLVCCGTSNFASGLPIMALMTKPKGIWVFFLLLLQANIFALPDNPGSWLNPVSIPSHLHHKLTCQGDFISRSLLLPWRKGTVTKLKCLEGRGCHWCDQDAQELQPLIVLVFISSESISM